MRPEELRVYTGDYRRVFDQGVWRNSTAKERKALLGPLKDIHRFYTGLHRTRRGVSHRKRTAFPQDVQKHLNAIIDEPTS